MTGRLPFRILQLATPCSGQCSPPRYYHRQQSDIPLQPLPYWARSKPALYGAFCLLVDAVTRTPSEVARWVVVDGREGESGRLGISYRVRWFGYITCDHRRLFFRIK
ncbi:hypothetical protein E2C01_020154 [Portunus trituberculatus]|uniref:Uncharacterized protein n=1 Tax=Portunus trituberculatus TaxID=210409 RepID=A0A5B7DZ25_PORTR|nr:hypothetical protein [Portunus trituberculatus]